MELIMNQNILELCVPPCLDTRYEVKKDTKLLELENNYK